MMIKRKKLTRLEKVQIVNQVVSADIKEGHVDVVTDRRTYRVEIRNGNIVTMPNGHAFKIDESHLC